MLGIINEIIDEIANNPLSYKNLRGYLRNLPRFKNYKLKSIDNALYLIRKDAFIKQELRGWIVTQAGKNYIKRKQDSLEQFVFNFSKDTPKDLLVMFDIPQEKKGEREWFRWQLKQADYVMIQKSVWVGPSPLPKEFLKYLETIGLKDLIKTFKLARDYQKIKSVSK